MLVLVGGSVKLWKSSLPEASALPRAAILWVHSWCARPTGVPGFARRQEHREAGVRPATGQFLQIGTF